MKIPYGVADFYRLRTRGQLYVDRTDRIAVVEELGDSLLFLRPRRFGKSLWLATLATYYDLRLEGEHEALFGDLAIGKAPTHRWLIATSCCDGTSPRSIPIPRPAGSMPA